MIHYVTWRHRWPYPLRRKNLFERQITDWKVLSHWWSALVPDSIYYPDFLISWTSVVYCHSWFVCALQGYLCHPQTCGTRNWDRMWSWWTLLSGTRGACYHPCILAMPRCRYSILKTLKWEIFKCRWFALIESAEGEQQSYLITHTEHYLSLENGQILSNEISYIHSHLLLRCRTSLCISGPRSGLIEVRSYIYSPSYGGPHPQNMTRLFRVNL